MPSVLYVLRIQISTLSYYTPATVAACSTMSSDSNSDNGTGGICASENAKANEGANNKEISATLDQKCKETPLERHSAYYSYNVLGTYLSIRRKYHNLKL